jgi:DNA-binding transcriptional LysR family regulator
MNPNNITLRQLRAFVAVADHESFVAASKKIGLSQPALSQSVRQIERELGARLFIRTTRSVHLTGIGLSFLTHARHLLRLLDDIAADMEHTIERRSGRMVVACLPSVAWRLMPLVLAEGTRLFPKTRIVVRDMSLASIRNAVLTGEVDIGIGSIAEDMAAFSSVIIVRDRMHALFRREDPFHAMETVEWDRLVDRPLVGMTEETGIRQILDRVTAANGAHLAYTTEVSGLATLTGLVEHGAGVTVVPGLALPGKDHPVLTARPLVAPDISRNIGLIWRRSTMTSPEAVRLLKAFDAVRRADVLAGDNNAFSWAEFSVPSES